MLMFAAARSHLTQCKHKRKHKKNKLFVVLHYRENRLAFIVLALIRLPILNTRVCSFNRNTTKVSCALPKIFSAYIINK